MTTDDQLQLNAELKRYPSVLTSALEGAKGELGELNATDRQRWAMEGIRIAHQTARAWEAAAEYYRASPRVLKILTFAQFLRWAETGAQLCNDSPTVAASFFRASPTALINLSPRHIGGWAALGRSLFQGTWKSSSLSARFFDSSPDLMTNLTYRDLELFTGLVETLSHRSYDLAAECLHLGQRVLPTIKERQELISLASTLAEQSWREVRGSFESASKINSSVHARHRSQYIALTEQLAKQGLANISGFILETTQALANIPSEDHASVLNKAEALAPLSPDAVGAFLKSLPQVLEYISTTQVGVWFDRGVETLKENSDAGVAYFRIESSRAEGVLDALSTTVELEKVKGLLGLYSRALAGSEVELLSLQQLKTAVPGWVSEENAATDGKHIFLPSVVDQHKGKAENFSWLKVMTTHQLGHLEFGSFEFVFDRAATLFEDLRHQLAVQRQQPTPETPFATDIAKFFDLFNERQLASDIFAVVEDARIDVIAEARYSGLAPAYQWVRAYALETRQPIESGSLKQAMVEILVRMSLDPTQPVPVPILHEDEARSVAALLRMVQVNMATVEDTAEATLRMYAIIAALPDEEMGADDLQNQDLQDAEVSEGSTQRSIEQLMEEQQGEDQEQQKDEEDSQYQPPQDVDFRGEFKPEMVQLLNMVRGTEPTNEQELETLSAEALEQLVKEQGFDEESQMSNWAAHFNSLLKRQMGNMPPAQPGFGQQDTPHQEEEAGSLEVKEPRSYVYDEWDFRAYDYRPRWCVVQEKQVLTGETRFFSDTLQTHAGLMSQIRRQFEAVRPELYRKVKRLIEGEDVDLDTAIEALIDLRSGVTPNEEIYWRRNKGQRDVAVVFLLDMSASTAEAVGDVKRDADWDAPNDAAAHEAWLRARRGPDGARRQYKRIIDVEKESMVLLMSALETIGDQYGVFGFSGFGRENVEFYIIKEMQEKLTEQVKRRLDKVSPLHATRMGPAIRHATTKLDQVEAKTKFLFVISDGRPQDRGYSREGVEKEYAVQDTHMALLEARQRDITPFCLTVDRQGHDYLRTMAGDMGYEVLPDVMDLPSRLPYLYRRLTV